MADASDRLLPVCELLLGAAYADAEIDKTEKAVVIKLLKQLLRKDDLPPLLETAIDAFDPDTFNVEEACSEFAEDPPVDKKKLVELVAAVNEADDVHDYDEDQYLRAVAKALDLGDDALEGLVVTYEIEELSNKLRAVTNSGANQSVPPPVPPATK